MNSWFANCRQTGSPRQLDRALVSSEARGKDLRLTFRARRIRVKEMMTTSDSGNFHSHSPVPFARESSSSNSNLLHSTACLVQCGFPNVQQAFPDSLPNRPSRRGMTWDQSNHLALKISRRDRKFRGGYLADAEAGEQPVQHVLVRDHSVIFTPIRSVRLPAPWRSPRLLEVAVGRRDQRPSRAAPSGQPAAPPGTEPRSKGRSSSRRPRVLEGCFGAMPTIPPRRPRPSRIRTASRLHGSDAPAMRPKRGDPASHLRSRPRSGAGAGERSLPARGPLGLGRVRRVAPDHDVRLFEARRAFARSLSHDFVRRSLPAGGVEQIDRSPSILRHRLHDVAWVVPATSETIVRFLAASQGVEERRSCRHSAAPTSTT